MVTPAAHREAAAYLQQTYEMSQRRACRVIAGDRSSVRYQARRADDAPRRERLKALAQERRRFGYRRLHVLLRREGHAVNRKRVQRLYREERLTVRRRGGRKRALGTRRPMETATAANQRWSLDFVSDQFTDGRRFRILEVYDDCTRECLALVADTSIGGRRVARAGRDHRLARQAGEHRQRQRHGADLQRHPGMGRPAPGRLALHCAGQAPAERLQRELQRKAARRVLERDPVQLPAGRPGQAGDLAARLQRGAAPLEPRLPHPHGVCPSPPRRERPARCAT